MNGDYTASARTFLSSQLDDRSTAVGSRVTKAAAELRSIGDRFRQTPVVSQLAVLTDRGAEYVDRFGTYLQAGTTDRFVSDLEDLTRQRPWTMTSGAVVVGFLASRFLKTSSGARYRARAVDPTAATNTPQMTALSPDLTAQAR